MAKSATPRLKDFALKIHGELFKVKGLVNINKWLEYLDGDGTIGVARPDSFCEWKDRAEKFPDVPDYKEE